MYKNTYTQKAVDNLFDIYTQKNANAQFYKIDGCLVDNYIITGDNLKTAIIKEVYLNEWSSAYSIILYNKTPKKYQRIIDLLNDGDDEKASRLFYQ